MKKTALCLSVLLLLISCATSFTSYQNDYYATIDMYVSTMTSVNKLYSQGNIPQEKYDVIISHARTFQNLMNFAKLALDGKNFAEFTKNLNSAKQELVAITTGVK